MNQSNALEEINSFYDDDLKCKLKKAEYFDKIAKLFYCGNFGSTNKSEIELLMFSIFMDEMITHNSSNGVLDYKKCSDFNMSKLLGIPPERVKTLKIKKQARYPQEFDWRKSLESIKNSIVYDIDKKRIIIPVNDPNLYLAMKNCIEEHDGYIEIQRGTNVLQMRPSHFFILMYWGIEKDDEKKVIKERVLAELRAKNLDNNLDNSCDDAKMIDKIIEIGDDTLDFFEAVVEDLNNPALLLIKGIRTIGRIVKTNRRI